MPDAAQRLLTMTGPFDATALPVRLRGSEMLSEPFGLTVEIISESRDLSADDMLFKPVCVTVKFESPTELPERHFHGVIRSFTATGGVGLDRWGYAAELVPSLWFLQQTSDCRVWQKKTAVDVVKDVLSDAGITSVEWNITGAPPVRETVTQFNETDLAFVTRLLEEEGCFYFFRHGESEHTLVIANDSAVFKDLPLAQSMSADDGAGYRNVRSWRQLSQTATGKVALLDYDPEKPRTLVQAEERTVLKAAGAAQRDSFAWPALTLKVDIAKSRAKQRIEAAEAMATLVEGAGMHTMFSPGGKFTVKGMSSGTFVLRSVSHDAVDESQWRADAAAPSYANRFTAFPAATKWRQPLTVPRPVMVGIHNAVVIGPDGQEIYADKFGRVQIRFFWDHRQDAKPQQDICWVRVIQPWAGTEGGSNWGWQHMPRIGTEVAVSFMDGDPDRPVVVGCFYNGVSMPVFDLSNREVWTKSGLRTRSATSAARGGGGDFSEFSFDDKQGSELVFLHAQKDMLTEVENDQTLKVDNCRIVTVKKDETIDIGKAQKIDIGNGRTVTVSQGDDKLTVSTGNIANKASAGAITIEAMQSITLKCGPSTLTIDPSGITLKGMTITVKGDLATNVEGLMTTIKGNAMLTLKGGIVMLN